MRVTADFWVSAVLRRVFSAGGYGAVVKRGAAEAGAVFVIVRSRFGTATLHAPRAQADYTEARPDERMFSPVLTDADDDAIEARLEKEKRFDPDLWIVEIEADEGLVEELL
jgi:hypothetical protein